MKSKETSETSKPTAKIESTGTHTRKCMVHLLNGQEFQCSVERNANGTQLLGQIRELLDIIEFDYFGLYFEDSTQHRYWLEAGKSIKKQLKNSPWKFHLSVKFYPSDPSQLAEDMSRYYMMLQLRDSIVSGRLPCSFVTHALLGSFVVQSELGDYDVTSMKGNYVAGFEFAPNQSSALEEKVIELHKTHKSLTPEEAEVAFLENVKKLPLYGVDQHTVKDSENIDLMLGVCWNGLRVYRDGVQINRFAWPRILKISYTRSKFYIRIRPVDDQIAESIVGFKVPNHRAAKKLWKSCVEHHTFFRLTKPDKPKQKLIRTGSRFRYTGQTQHQTRETIAASTRKNVPKIQRTASRRSYSASEKPLSGKASSSDTQSPPELPRKEHSTTTTTEVVTVTEEIVTEKVKQTQKPITEVIEEVTTTEETVEIQQRAEEAESKSLGTSSSSSLSSMSDEDALTKHQRKVHKMKPRKQGEKTNADGKFLQEPPPGSTGSSEWDLRLQSSPAKNANENETEKNEEGKKAERITQQSRNEVTVVTTVTTEVVEEVQTTKEREEEDSSSSSSEDEEQEKISQDERPAPLPDFVPAVEPTTSTKSSSSSSEDEEEDAEQKEDIQEEKEEDQMPESTTVLTEYHFTETVIQNQHVENGMVEKQSTELEKEEEEAVSREEYVAQEEDSSSTSSQSSSSSSSSESEEEEKEPEVEAPPVKEQDAPPVEEDVNENNNNNEDIIQPETSYIDNSENVITTQNIITTVETKSVRVEDVVIPREDNEVRKVALTADLDNNVTVTETRSTSSSSSSSSSDSESEDEAGDAAVNGFKKPPIVETKVVYVEPTEEEKPAVTTEPPLVHTETKTITYESSQHQPDVIDSSNDIQLLSSQTISAETMSSVTTTHITKTVVGHVSETRVEKSIVITADGDANLHEAMAEAIRDTQETNPDVSITRVVVHEEKVVENQ